MKRMRETELSICGRLEWSAPTFLGKKEEKKNHVIKNIGILDNLRSEDPRFYVVFFTVSNFSGRRNRVCFSRGKEVF